MTTSFPGILRFSLFNDTVFNRVREILCMLYLADQECLVDGEHPHPAFPVLNQHVSFETFERFLNCRQVEPACPGKPVCRCRRTPGCKVIDQPVPPLIFHLYAFLMVVNKG